MDSTMPRDLRGALEEATATFEIPVEVRRVCVQCKSLPADGKQLHYCGRCQVVVYCSKQCSQTDWKRGRSTSSCARPCVRTARNPS
mmetsp:Transcript_7609/g.18853  ORF Transcript_7609/g.18853 Transcript_7609/m.18853 type:complete len:86 (-) Transcript_7609:451-708(-)